MGDDGTTCNWCLRERPVQTIEHKLWRFWGLISNEDPLEASLRDICEKCKLRYEEFSIRIERWKCNESTVAKTLASRRVKDEFTMDIEYHPVIKQEISSLDDTVPSVDEGESATALPSGPDRPLECSFCHKRYPKPYRLKIHLRAHTGDRPWACPHCDKSFTESTILNRHLGLYPSCDKPFECPYCDKVFARTGHLISHRVVHTGERPFRCPHCDKTMARSSDLKKHLRTHTGETPFKCTHCGRTFADSSALKGHSRVHTGEKPFKCERCGKAFRHSGHWRRHVESCR